MATTANEESNPRRFALPWDMSEWVPRAQLLEWTHEEIGSLDWDNPELVRRMAARPSWQPRFHLVLLVYASALGQCGSEGAAELLYEDAALKSAFPRHAPEAAALRRFRRENHGLLRWGVEQVFKRALKAQCDLGSGLIPAGIQRLIRNSASVRLDAARHLDRGMHDE